MQPFKSAFVARLAYRCTHLINVRRGWALDTGHCLSSSSLSLQHVSQVLLVHIGSAVDERSRLKCPKFPKWRPANRLCDRSSIGSAKPMIGCENGTDTSRRTGIVVVDQSSDGLRSVLLYRSSFAGHINNMYNTCFWKLVSESGLSANDAQQRLKVTSPDPPTRGWRSSHKFAVLNNV